jgi:hypothetical protein
VNYFRVLVYLGGEMQSANVMVVDAERYEVVAVQPGTDSMSWVRFYGEDGSVVTEFNGDKVAVIQRISADEAQAILFEEAEYRQKDRG